MSSDTPSSSIRESVGLDAQSLAQRKALVLDALSRMTRDFAQEPNFRMLVETFIETLSGQFGVHDAFAMIRSSNPTARPAFYHAIGAFQGIQSLADRDMEMGPLAAIAKAGSPIAVGDLESSGVPGDTAQMFIRSGVSVVVPLFHDGSFVGVVGVGAKIDESLFGDEEIDLLATLVNTVSPLLVNSYLFMEIVTLKTWYIDILDSVGQGVFIFGEHGTVKKVNAVGEKVLCAAGLAAAQIGEFVGTPMRELFPEMKFPGWLARLQKRIDAGDFGRVENLAAWQDDGEHLYAVHLSAIQEGQAGVRDLIVTLDDITATQEVEDRLRRLQQSSDKGMMVSAISHELSNLLTLITGSVELAETVIERGQPEQAGKMLKRIKAASKRMERFTSSMMDSHKIESKKSKLNVNHVIEDVLGYIVGQKRFMQICVDANLGAMVPELMLDKDQMSQLLLNFLNNAADAILEASRGDGRMLIKTHSDAENVHVEISDNGCGMTERTRTRLFQSHFTTKTHGHGYGLMTCSRILEDHSATILVDSTVGQGTTFHILVPIYGVSDSSSVAPNA
jgi:signal transduction histidine kinase